MGNIASSLFSVGFIVFLVMAVGYLVGSINIRGIFFGTAGVFLVAMLFGIIARYVPFFTVGGKEVVLYLDKAVTLPSGEVLGSTKGMFSLVSNIGTSMFVTAVGLIAGPKFFRTFNRKTIGYVLMGIIIIGFGVLVTIAIIVFVKDPNMDSSLAIGLLTGALTTTPGFSAAMEIAPHAEKVQAGYGIGYLFGVLGVVLFVQLIPKILKLDMAEEKRRFVAANSIDLKKPKGKLFPVDPQGFFPFVLAILVGNIIGCIHISIFGIDFSLGVSGGTLVAGLIIGHFGHIGPLDCRADKSTLSFFQELGLCFFLVGAGVPGGVNAVSNMHLSYFIYGAIMTTVPMLAGFVLGKYVFKLSIFNNLAAITGGMTSTPALGALISLSETSAVTNAYAVAYPFALFFVVLASRIIVLVM